MLTALTILSSLVAATMGVNLLRPSNDGWQTKSGAAVFAIAAFSLLFLALHALLPLVGGFII
ncbi:hypothetical protein DEM27_06520 [Metarhizobium album]|uniref:Uncharacterized protein n=1 Tax=Metarhizobium album TaxID=2182425 RepID=A0A2U2DVG6_9HYPH|nr:hypothetical protein DEM27_06520 [Rhizobium album]